MDRLAKQRLLPNYDKVDLFTCEHYLVVKIPKNHPLQLVHSEVYGLMNVKVRHGAYYFIMFIDDYTCFGIVYLKTYKS